MQSGVGVAKSLEAETDTLTTDSIGPDNLSIFKLLWFDIFQ